MSKAMAGTGLLRASHSMVTTATFEGQAPALARIQLSWHVMARLHAEGVERALSECTLKAWAERPHARPSLLSF